MRSLTKTDYAHVSLVDATLRLFEAAYNKTNCEHVILLCESSIPIVNARDLVSELKALAGKSIINYSIPPVGSDHYARKKVLPKQFQPDPFFYHDQWIALSRGHADFLLGSNWTNLFKRMYAPDEHYFMNVLTHLVGVGQEDIVKRAITFVDWKNKEISLMSSPLWTGPKRVIRPKTFDRISASDILAARKKNSWFLRKVGRSCVCDHIVNFVQTRPAARDA